VPDQLTASVAEFAVNCLNTKSNCALEKGLLEVQKLMTQQQEQDKKQDDDFVPPRVFAQNIS
jgi:hypothetical protein